MQAPPRLRSLTGGGRSYRGVDKEENGFEVTDSLVRMIEVLYDIVTY